MVQNQDPPKKPEASDLPVYEDVIKNKEDKLTEANTRVDFDDLLSSAGEFGLYQIILFFSTFPFYIYGVFAYFTQLFLTEVSPNHWCWIPELENLTSIERRRLAIPADDNRFGYSHCKAYAANWTELLLTGTTPNETWPIISCQNGWEFNKTEIPYPTISSELGWVCDRDSYQATAQAIFFVGSICGGFVIGFIADRFGRLPATIVSNIIGCLGGIISVFARNFLEFAICRFITGLAYDNCMMMVYLLVLEFVAPKYRSIMANVSFAIFYAIGATSLPWIVLASGHWKTTLLVTSLPLGLAVLSPLFLLESPRWLLSRGRIDEAVKKVLFIAKKNKKDVPLKLIEQFKLSASKQNQENTGSMLELMKRPVLRNMFIRICVLYCCCALVFDGLVRSIGQLDFDFFISFSVISLTEFPSVFILAFIMDWMGRRWVVLIAMTMTAIFSILTVFVPSVLVSVMCAVVARFTQNMAYGASMQWCAEMLPASARGSGVAIIHMFGLFGYIIAPFIIYLKNYIYWLPLVVIGCISSSSGLISLTLPETANIDMPQTFEDAEELIMNKKFWDIPCLRKKKDVTGHDNDRMRF